MIELIVNVLEGNLKISRKTRETLTSSKKILRKLSQAKSPNQATRAVHTHYKTVVKFLKLCLPHLRESLLLNPVKKFTVGRSLRVHDDVDDDCTESSCDDCSSDDGSYSDTSMEEDEHCGNVTTTYTVSSEYSTDEDEDDDDDDDVCELDSNLPTSSVRSRQHDGYDTAQATNENVNEDARMSWGSKVDVTGCQDQSLSLIHI